jgi:hypothetical protein
MRGRVAFALATGVAVFVVLLGLAVFWQTAVNDGPVSSEGAKLVDGVLAVIVGALAVYLGGTTYEKVKDHGDGTAEAPEPEPAEAPEPEPLDRTVSNDPDADYVGHDTPPQDDPLP